ncbi:YchJ family protein [Brucepastera parasyntrophica]|uniref:YchJ family protein n=1 Tax=Brucepastera parasyntrophica TaxID=2880008 RepID=UPI0021095DD9|nr:YchJ family protein [Brucepastera parasyntrophica]ULQ58737.1 YchJ family protein [Brucepastera parasyntrophica]
MEKDFCSCGSGKKYQDCCEPIISGKTLAPTAETLMRARYTAYAVHNIDFITDSCLREKGQNDIDLEETRRWSEDSQWLGLKIHRTEKGSASDQEGVVEFSASYIRNGLKDEHRETASFKKVNGKWYFSEGRLANTTIVRASPKVGRNDPCPCGSGKKYKQCCLSKNG